MGSFRLVEEAGLRLVAGMSTGKNEQSAAALPFRTQIWVDERVRTGDCYRNAGNRQNECHGAQRSRPSPDEIHELSSQIGCAECSPRRQTIYAFGEIAPSCSGFTIGQFGGRML